MKNADMANTHKYISKYASFSLRICLCIGTALLLNCAFAAIVFSQESNSPASKDTKTKDEATTVKVDDNTRKKFLTGGIGDKDKFDRSSPVHIGADSLIVNAKDRVFTYKGKVEAFQNDLLITGEILEGTYDTQNQLEKIVCKDHVVITRGNRMRATANRAEYDIKTNVIVLTEGPEVVERTNALSADRIILYIDEDRSEAQGRVRVKLVKSEADSLLGSIADIKKNDSKKNSDTKNDSGRNSGLSNTSNKDKKVTDKKNSKGKK